MLQDVWKELSLREKIGQTMMIKADPAREIKEFGSIREFLAKYPVGGVFICREALTDQDGDITTIIRAYREASPLSLLVAADAENGCGSLAREMTTLPQLMALGATGSTELARAYGHTIALESAALGIDWSFSPVADLNLNPFNPITNVRAIGDTAEAAIPLLTAVVRGMQDGGLIATAKHFPGDGVDYRDQHLVTTANSLSMEDWRRNHGAVFTALIGAGVDAVMTGHISLPAYQSRIAEGGYLPATLSHELTTRLLKEELGFGGVVISDALDMGGFLKWYGRGRGEVECFKAGTDMLLWPSCGYIDAVEEAIASGEIPLSRLDEAVSRIRGLKERHGLLAASNRSRRELTAEEMLFTENTAVRVAEGSVTLLRDRRGRLPLKRPEVRNALVIGITA
ncbi:MAG: glycoside hydrolase family 3 protein, partial [Bacteroidota bacterium]